MTKDTKKGRAGLAGTKYRIKCGINVATRLNCCDNTGSCCGGSSGGPD